MIINIITICTGKYVKFFNSLYSSSEEYFLPNYKKNYYIFTDGEILNASNIIKIHQPKLGWPYDTMMRFEMFNRLKLHEHEYVYFLNANMNFVSKIDHNNTDIFPGPSNDFLLGVRHPGHYSTPKQYFPYERRIISRFHIPEWCGKYYYQGCFNGGRVKEFMEMSSILSVMIREDLSVGITPVWHDESALNWYYYHKQPILLDPGYAYPESWNIPFKKKIIQLDKSKLGGHEALRS